MNPRQGRGRTTATIQTDLLKVFPYFIKESKKRTIDSSRIRIRSFSIITLLKLLSSVKSHDMTFSDLYRDSQIIMKKSYLSYLQMCIYFGLLAREERGKQHTYYSITEKGKILLDLFRR